MRQLIRHRQGVIHAITPNNGNTRFLKGAHFALVTKPGTSKGARYTVTNTSSATPGVGGLNIPPSGLTIRVNQVDLDFNDHNQHISTMQAGDKLVIGGVEAVLAQPPIWNTGVFAVFVVALPVVADGEHLVTIVRA